MPPSLMSYNSKHSKILSSEREEKKENDEDDGYESSGWRWWCDGDYMIVMTILSGFENLRNQFLYFMGRIRTLWRKGIILEQIFSFFSSSKFIYDKIQLQVLSDRSQLYPLFLCILYTCQKGLGIKTWIGIRGSVAGLTSKIQS